MRIFTFMIMGEKEKKAHPIVEKAVSLSYMGSKTLEFDDYAVEQIEDLLKEYYGTPELKVAIQELLKLGVVLNERGSSAAALKVFEAITSAKEALDDLVKRGLI